MAEQPNKQQIAEQNKLNINQSPDSSQQQFGDRGVEVGYSNMGPHGLSNEDAENAPDGYGNQDQFGDIDGQDPYTNLNDTATNLDASDADTDDTKTDADLDDTATDTEAAADLGDPTIGTQNKTPIGEDFSDVSDELYGLAEPLAKEGDSSRQGSNKDSKGTRISQDQQGYQQ